MDFPGGTSGKEPTCQCRRHKRCGFDPWVRKMPWRRAWQSIPVFLPGESHGQWSLVGYSPWGHKESEVTEATARKALRDHHFPWSTQDTLTLSLYSHTSPLLHRPNSWQPVIDSPSLKLFYPMNVTSLKSCSRYPFEIGIFHSA